MTEFQRLLDILRSPLDHPWRAHGIGMLRLYFDPEETIRINIWHDRLINPGISTMHSHPWDFRSRIICGRLINYRYGRKGLAPASAETRNFMEGKISCGPHFNGIEGEPEEVTLISCGGIYYRAGASYRQSAEEIHETKAENGTITLMTRGKPCEGHHASVFWPVGHNWGDASRETTREDVEIVCEAALRRMQATYG